jgi:hypothetical protein
MLCARYLVLRVGRWAIGPGSSHVVRRCALREILHCGSGRAMIEGSGVVVGRARVTIQVCLDRGRSSLPLCRWYLEGDMCGGIEELAALLVVEDWRCRQG